MRIGFSSSMDHNQMLVVSVALHLLIIMAIMFSPKPKIMQKRIVPAFDVEVLEIPARRIGEPRKEPKAETVKPAPPSEKTEAPPQKPTMPPPVKKAEVPNHKAPEPKRVEKKAPLKPPEKTAPATSKIVEELERLEEKPKPPGIINELDQLAKLEPALTPKKQAPVKIQKVEKPKIPAPVEEREIKQEPLKKEDTREAEFDNLASKSLVLEKESKEKSAIDLAEDLKRQMMLETVKSQKIKPEVTSKQVDLSVVSKPAFNSALRKLDIHDSKKTAQEGQKASPLPHPKSPSDTLSLYAGAIEEKIYSNWKSPLGAKSNEVYVSFFLFPKGNIGKSFVEKSSGNEQLDALAIRAILDSEPFPAFPPDLKEPSLHFTIHFKYVPQG